MNLYFPNIVGSLGKTRAITLKIMDINNYQIWSFCWLCAYFVFFDMVSICSSRWPQTIYPPASASSCLDIALQGSTLPFFLRLFGLTFYRHISITMIPWYMNYCLQLNHLRLSGHPKWVSDTAIILSFDFILLWLYNFFS